MQRAKHGIEAVGEEWWREAIDARSAELARKMNAHRTPVWRLDVYPFTQEALGAIARKALAGDLISARIIRQVIAMGQGGTEPSPKDHFSCLTCDCTFTMRQPPSYLSVLTARCNDPADARISGICHHCVRRFGSEESIQKAAFEACRRNVISTNEVDYVSTGWRHPATSSSWAQRQ